MKTIKSNEVEWNSDLISFLQGRFKDQYPFDSASHGTSLRTRKGVRYPDVLLFINREAKLASNVWELKNPDTNIRDKSLLENAILKTEAIKANFFVTWNGRETILWKTEDYRLENVKEIKCYDSISEIVNNEVSWVKYKVQLEKRATEILEDLSDLNEKGFLRGGVTYEELTLVDIFITCYSQLQPLFKEKISIKKRKKGFKEEYQNWRRNEGYDPSNPFLDEMLGRQVSFTILTKIFFASVLGQYSVRGLSSINLSSDVPEDIKNELEAHYKLINEIDFNAIYRESFIDQIEFSKEIADIIKYFITSLNNLNLKNVEGDIIGNIFEISISNEEKRKLGQYYTSDKLVNLILSLTTDSDTKKILDPTCGTGPFLSSAYDFIKYYNNHYEHKQI
ncbi:N-6 DNA methylase, partial [Neobacillus niacini]|uniref:N-6 DNA methylase n=1 Tax=Neobacillus niacini TaxID=86668 RepID=UPI003002BD29